MDAVFVPDLFCCFESAHDVCHAVQANHFLAQVVMCQPYTLEVSLCRQERAVSNLECSVYMQVIRSMYTWFASCKVAAASWSRCFPGGSNDKISGLEICFGRVRSRSQGPVKASKMRGRTRQAYQNKTVSHARFVPRSKFAAPHLGPNALSAGSKEGVGG